MKSSLFLVGALAQVLLVQGFQLMNQQPQVAQHQTHHLHHQQSNYVAPNYGAPTTPGLQGRLPGNSLHHTFHYSGTVEQVLQQSLTTSRHIHMVYRTPKNFYGGCGSSVRKCAWIKRVVPVARKQNMMSKIAGVFGHQAQQHDQNEQHETIMHAGEEGQAPVPQQPKVHFDHICSVTHHVCVGNDEHCVSKRNCDVAMRITEIVYEGKHNFSQIAAISTLDRCKWEVKSEGSDDSMPQRYFGIGFAPYDEHKHLQCRIPRATDFKLIYLQKNPRACVHKPDNCSSIVRNHQSEIIRDQIIFQSICKALKGHHHGKHYTGNYNLKSFLTHHVQHSHYTPFFQPPFTFADNFEVKTSQNGMVVTGTANEL